MAGDRQSTAAAGGRVAGAASGLEAGQADPAIKLLVDKMPGWPTSGSG